MPDNKETNEQIIESNLFRFKISEVEVINLDDPLEINNININASNESSD